MVRISASTMMMVAVLLVLMVVPAISASPTAGYTYTPSSGDLPLTVAFTDASTGAIWYNWVWGDSTANSTLQNPSHIFTAAGTYTVIQTVRNVDGSSSTSHSVTVTSGSSYKIEMADPAATVYPNVDNSTYNTMIAYLFSGSHVGFNILTLFGIIMTPLVTSIGLPLTALILGGSIALILYGITENALIPGVLMIMFAPLSLWLMPADAMGTCLMFLFLGITAIIYGIVKRK